MFAAFSACLMSVDHLPGVKHLISLVWLKELYVCILICFVTPSQVKLGLLQHGSFDVAKDCTKTCVEMGHAWVPAALSLELLRMGKIGVSRFSTLQRWSQCTFHSQIKT